LVSDLLPGLDHPVRGRAGPSKVPRRPRLRFVLLVARLVCCLGLSAGLSGPSLMSRRLQRLLHLILLGGQLQRLVDLALDFLSGRMKRLLHLLTHGLDQLVLQLVKDGLDGLADLLLKSLMQVSPRRGGRFLLAALVRCAIIRARPSRSRQPSGLCFVV